MGSGASELEKVKAASAEEVRSAVQEITSGLLGSCLMVWRRTATVRSSWDSVRTSSGRNQLLHPWNVCEDLPEESRKALIAAIQQVEALKGDVEAENR